MGTSIDTKPRQLSLGFFVGFVKHFLPGTSLTAKDIAKIQAYYKAAKSKTKVYNKMPIEKVEFVFSSKEAYEGSFGKFSAFRKYIFIKYINNKGEIKP